MSEKFIPNMELFGDLLKHQKNLSLTLDKINTKFPQPEGTRFEQGQGYGEIPGYLTATPDDREFQVLLCECVIKSTILNNAVKEAMLGEAVKWQAQKLAEKEARKAERIDMWKLWGEKLIRWSVGAVAAVLLYSSVSWFAGDGKGFIKVPIKDWFAPVKVSDAE